jgi:23S rRNA (adenine2503-C2)-methyltransferase
MKASIYDFTRTTLADHLVAEGFKDFNATQIYEWLYRHRERDFHAMTNLSKDLRSYLDRHFTAEPLPIELKRISDDRTEKYLFMLDDKHAIETVLMSYDYGQSVCVTSQVGCNMGCSFCASGLKKKTRDVTAGEMVRQVLSIAEYADVDVSNVVVMGTGEPFDNYDEVMRFIHIINDDVGLAIGQRHITVSTCGIVPKIIRYAHEDIRPNLAISLHAPNDELRSKLMPINRTYPLADVIDACETYFEQTHRRITFEYILLAHVNDSIDLADQLSDLIRGLNAYVNLIPYNPVGEFRYEKTEDERATAFYDRLKKRGITVTLRREQGADIEAACGQLRMKEKH